MWWEGNIFELLVIWNVNYVISLVVDVKITTTEPSAEPVSMATTSSSKEISAPLDSPMTNLTAHPPTTSVSLHALPTSTSPYLKATPRIMPMTGQNTMLITMWEWVRPMFAILVIDTVWPALPNMTTLVLDVQIVFTSGSSMVLFVDFTVPKVTTVLKWANLLMLHTAITLPQAKITLLIVNACDAIQVVHTAQVLPQHVTCVWILIFYWMIDRTAWTDSTVPVATWLMDVLLVTNTVVLVIAQPISTSHSIAQLRAHLIRGRLTLNTFCLSMRLLWTHQITDIVGHRIREHWIQVTGLDLDRVILIIVTILIYARCVISGVWLVMDQLISNVIPVSINITSGLMLIHVKVIAL